MLRILTTLAFGLLTLALPVDAQEGGRRPIEGRSQHFVVRFVDDRGEPIHGARVSIGRCLVQRTKRGTSGSWHGLLDAPRVTDPDGSLAIPVQRGWKGTLSIGFVESDLFGHADDSDGFELEWDGRVGARTITIPRLGAAHVRVLSTLPLQRLDHSISNLSTTRFALPGLQPTLPWRYTLREAGDGSFEIDDLTPGTFEITIYRGAASCTNEITVRPGETTMCPVFDLTAPGGWIVGSARGVDGTACVGASVDVTPGFGFGASRLDSELDNEAIIGADGAFRIGPLRPGLYRVNLVPTTETSSPEIPSVYGDPIASRLVWCPPTGSRRVDLVAPDVGRSNEDASATQESARVEVALAESVRDWTIRVQAGEDMRARVAERRGPGERDVLVFDDLPPGRCTVVAIDPDGTTRFFARRTTAAGYVTAVQVAPQRFGRIVLPRAELDAIAAHRLEFDIAPSEHLGLWSPDAVPPGTTHVLLQAEGRAALHAIQIDEGERVPLVPRWQPTIDVEIQLTFEGRPTTGFVRLRHELGFERYTEGTGLTKDPSATTPARARDLLPGTYDVLVGLEPIGAIEVTRDGSRRFEVELR